MSQTVGSRICLISNSDIRYEGLLHSIDSGANTVSLTNVRIFGTEGRRNGMDEVPQSDQLFELIIFRGADIKDLSLFEKTPSAAMDPAIVSATPASNTRAMPRSTGGRTGGFYDQAPQVRQGGNVSNNRRGGYRGGYGNNNNNGGNNNGGNNNNNGGRYNHGHRGSYSRGGGGGGAGGGGYRRRQNEHTGRDFVPATGDAKEEFKEDFDFTKSREEFEKKKNEFEKAKEDAKSHTKAYTKTSFFDNVSCDQKDKNQGRVDREEMKKADTETFGTEMVGNMRGFRRGRGGRGRYNRNY